jgi:hypothetical protein
LALGRRLAAADSEDIAADAASTGVFIMSALHPSRTADARAAPPALVRSWRERDRLTIAAIADAVRSADVARAATATSPSVLRTLPLAVVGLAVLLSACILLVWAMVL